MPNTPLPLPNKPTPAQVREYLFDRYAGFNGKIATNVAFDIELELGTFMQASINQRRAVTMYLPWHSTVRDSEGRVSMVHGAWRTLEESGDTWRGGKTILPPIGSEREILALERARAMGIPIPEVDTPNEQSQAKPRAPRMGL
jgi:hypothetical protein